VTEGRASDPYAVLAVAAAGWDRFAGRLGGPARDRLAELLAVVRRRRTDEATRRSAAEEAAGLLRRELPEEFGPGQEGRLAGSAPAGAETVHLGFRAEDLAVLLCDGHRMVGPVLGPVRERLLAAPAWDADTVLRRGGDPHAPDLIRLPGPGGRDRLPRFQFSEGTLPRPVVLEVNALLEAGRDPWGAADWWLSPNAWLDTAPAGLLGTGRDRRLVEVAGYLNEED
jgi:hypothetical protein